MVYSLCFLFIANREKPCFLPPRSSFLRSSFQCHEGLLGDFRDYCVTIPKIFLKDFLKTFLRPSGSKGYG